MEELKKKIAVIIGNALVNYGTQVPRDIVDEIISLISQTEPVSEVPCSAGLETFWQTKKPTLPGWYWYEDEYYGPAPVKVEWTGFVKNPDARQLEIIIACGGDSEQPLGEVESLSKKGRWRALWERKQKQT